MAPRLVIEKFVPPRFSNAALRLEEIERLFARSLHYAANGRSALYRIIMANPTWNRMLLPTYLCASVLIPLRQAKIEPIFYDIDPDDLNGNLDSLEEQADRHGVQVALLPSMYGNPADMLRAETLCRNKGIHLIDDAAQSFGAELQGKPIGSFGDAGFFSVSPGKPLAGHMGAFFWSDKPEVPARTRHDLIHRIKWLDFRIRRLNAYSSGNIPLLNLLLEYGTLTLTKFVDLSLDEMAPFEAPILGGLLNDALSGQFEFRQHYFDAFVQQFAHCPDFSVVRATRGTPCNHKIVLCCASRELAQHLSAFLRQRRIHASRGYPLLSPGNAALKHAAQIDGRVVELPIEKDAKRMTYLFDVINEFNDGRNTRL